MTQQDYDSIIIFKQLFNEYFSKIKYNYLFNTYFDVEKIDFDYEKILEGSYFLYSHIDGVVYIICFRNMKLYVNLDFMYQI